MYSYERSYATARTVLTFLEAIAWLMVGLGVILALAFVSASQSSFGGNSLISIFMAMMPGIVISIVGLILVALVQVGIANVDTAEMTGEMLRIARNNKVSDTLTERYGSSVNHETLPKQPEQPTEQNELDDLGFDQRGQLTYKGKEIQRNDNKFLVGGAVFSTLDKAKDYINRCVSMKW